MASRAGSGSWRQQLAAAESARAGWGCPTVERSPGAIAAGGGAGGGAGSSAGGGAGDVFPVYLAPRRAPVCYPATQPESTTGTAAHDRATAHLAAPGAAPSSAAPDVRRFCTRRTPEPAPSKLSPGAVACAAVPPLQGLRFWSQVAQLSDEEADAQEGAEAEAEGLEGILGGRGGD